LIPAYGLKDENLLMIWCRSCLIAGLITVAAVTTGDAKVLRNKHNSQTVWIFKDADALRRFDKLRARAVYDESVVAPLLSCKAPQGSKIDVLGSGYRTAFVRIVDGSAIGCEGTVLIGNVRDQ
jgi:lysyl-tRNA synthetase class I